MACGSCAASAGRTSVTSRDGPCTPTWWPRLSSVRALACACRVVTDRQFADRSIATLSIERSLFLLAYFPPAWYAFRGDSMLAVCWELAKPDYIPPTPSQRNAGSTPADTI